MAMRKIKSMIHLLWILLSHRPIQTIYINFKMLPLKQAIRLPIFIYTSTEFRSLEGKIQINGRIFPNMIRIGDNTRYPTTSRPLSIWTINGQLIFNGPTKFFQGTYVYVGEKGVLQIGTNGTFIGSDTKIICRDNISIGDCVEITWECQIYDTSFHYVQKEGEDVQSLTKGVVINDFVWIGNRTTLSKGSVIPSYSIVAAGSLCNKDLSQIEGGGDCSLFAGSPAICKATGIKRIFSFKEEAEYDKLFDYPRFRL